MLYRFKSQATADVVMLEANARQLLDIIGKEAGAQGIIVVDQIPAAIEAIKAAIERESKQGQRVRDALADHEASADDPELQQIGLYQRASPLLHMLRRAHAEGKDVVWGV